MTAGPVAMEGGGRPSATQAVLLAASTAVTALLYSVYRQKARVARGLEVGARGAAGGVPGPDPRARGLVAPAEPRPLFAPRRAPGGSGWTGTCEPCCWRRPGAACPMPS